MKSFVISMLFAAAAAQAGYECVNPGDAWTVETLGDTPTDAATCKTACQAFIDAADTPTDNDWCCAVSVVDGGEVTCGLLSFATAADTDIRAEATAVEGTTFEAWAWAAGVEIEEEEEVVEEDAEDDAEDEEDDEEDDEDMSVRMTLSALATASIAMLAM